MGLLFDYVKKKVSMHRSGVRDLLSIFATANMLRH